VAGPGTCLNDIDVVVLAGGLGTRVSDVLGDTPKLLAPIGGQPFLDILIGRLRAFGLSRLLLGLGHLGGRVVDHMTAHPAEEVEVVTVLEQSPQGTAGALRLIAPQIASDPVLVMNGDSFTGADLCDFAAAHRRSGAAASILAAEVADTSRFGRMVVGADGRVAAFAEKSPAGGGRGLINAGVYLFSAGMLEKIRAMPGPSLEKDVFQNLGPGTLNAVVSRASFIDIGTPADLKRAETVLAPYISRP